MKLKYRKQLEGCKREPKKLDWINLVGIIKKVNNDKLDIEILGIELQDSERQSTSFSTSNCSYHIPISLKL